MQPYNRREHHFSNCYSYPQCCCQPPAQGYSQTFQYLPQFQPHFESQLPKKPFKSSFSIESLLGSEKHPELSKASFRNTPVASKQQDTSVATKLKGLVERRRNNSAVSPHSSQGNSTTSTELQLQKATHLDGKPASSATSEEKKGFVCTHFKRKRPRTMFTIYQLERMEGEFLRRQYITGNQRLQLARELQLSETQVRVWFQNRRIKWRKEMIKRQFNGY